MATPNDQGPPPPPSTVVTTSVTNPSQHDTTQPTIPPTATNPKIASLASIFPDFDHTILEDVLSSTNGDEDRAVDILLGMSDPDHVPAVQAQGTNETDLDEQLAHRLFLEEQQEQQYSPLAQPGNLAYTPRINAPSRRSLDRNQASGEPGLQDQFRDFVMPARTGNAPARNTGNTGAELQEQFNKFAETGKKTFNNIFNKVKAKMQELDGSGSTQPAQQQQGQQPQNEASWNQHQAGASSQPHAQPIPSQGQPTPNWGGGYDMTAPAPQESARPLNVPSINPTVSANPFSGPPAQASSPSTSPPARSSIDGSKFGLLPKRPLSTTAANTGSQTATSGASTNPFAPATTAPPRAEGNNTASVAPLGATSHPRVEEEVDDLYVDNPFKESTTRPNP